MPRQHFLDVISDVEGWGPIGVLRDFLFGCVREIWNLFEEKEVLFLMDNMLLIYEVKDERKNTTENLTAGTNMEPKDSVLWVDVFPDPLESITYDCFFQGRHGLSWESKGTPNPMPPPPPKK